jgi:predicted PurR-regulated permease PerM
VTAGRYRGTTLVLFGTVTTSLPTSVPVPASGPDGSTVVHVEGPQPELPVLDDPGRLVDPLSTAPPWLLPVIRFTVRHVIIVGLLTTVLVLMLLQARSLVSVLVISLFFGIAMDPAVTALHARRGWPRGAATALVFLVVVTSVVLLFAVLVPAIVQVVGEIGSKLPGWITSLQDATGVRLPADVTSASTDLEGTVASWLQDHATTVLGLASTGFGAVFQFFTIAMFTFYFAADAPRVRRAFLVRLPPARQERLGWAWDTAVQQTGGYFYSRLLLMIVNGALFFVVLLLVGVPPLVALPLAVFEGFVAEFIPAVGTYIGAAIPLIVVLGTQGAVPAVVVLVWTVLYQQVENYWLAPKISAKTMEINGGVAFGAALAGGAVAGPMGAFMALPVAALITSFVSHYVRKYPLSYQSAYDRSPSLLDDTAAPEPT